MEMAAMGGALVFMLLAVIIGLLFAGLILKLSVRLVAGFSPGYGRSLLTVLAAAVLAFLVNIVVTMVFGVGGGMMGGGLAGSDPDAAATALAGAGMAMMGVMAVSAIVNLVIIAACVNWMIKRPGGIAIGFGRSLLVALVYMIIFIVISIIVGAVIGMLGMGAGLMAGM